MLEIHFGAEQETLRTFSTVLDLVTIGSAPGCSLELDGEGVAATHCQLERDEAGRWIAVPYAPMSVNGHELSTPVVLGAQDRIRIGSVSLQLKPIAHEAGEEELMLGARDDLAGRSVYADWLEERGQWDRAEFLRLTISADELASGDPRFAETTTRIQKLASCLDPVWRMQIASAEVENCKVIRREFTCNMTWDRLTQTEDPFVRSCGECQNQVHYCRTEAEAEQHVRNRHCLVLDLSIDPFDVRMTGPHGVPEESFPIAMPGMYVLPSYVERPERACPACQVTVPAGFRFCPQCGTPS